MTVPVTTKVWVFTLVVSGVVENVKVVDLDMEKEITQYAATQVIEALDDDPTEYPEDANEAWAIAYDAAEESGDITASLRIVTIGDLNDD